MTTHYLIHSSKTGRTLKVSYKGNSFFRLELAKGKKLQKDEIMIIGMAIPAHEHEMDEYQRTYKSLEYTKLEAKQSQYQQYVSAWFAFYQNYRQLPPRFNKADGLHINQIKKYLTRLSDQDQEGLELFKLILENWHKLDQFHQDNTDLKYINSRLNPILNAIKKAGQAGTAGTDNSVSI
tara:strand:+ start:16491 stop:17027 length:537 start_codon:yes stop_codon:yes gene_type:complete